MNEWHCAEKGHLHYFQPSRVKLPKSRDVRCHLLEWFIFAPFMGCVPQNKDLILHTLNCGAVLWAGISWANAGAMIVSGAWRKHGPPWAQLGGKTRTKLFSVKLAFGEKVCSLMGPHGSLTPSSHRGSPASPLASPLLTLSVFFKSFII